MYIYILWQFSSRQREGDTTKDRTLANVARVIDGSFMCDYSIACKSCVSTWFLRWRFILHHDWPAYFTVWYFSLHSFSKMEFGLAKHTIVHTILMGVSGIADVGSYKRESMHVQYCTRIRETWINRWSTGRFRCWWLAHWWNCYWLRSHWFHACTQGTEAHYAKGLSIEESFTRVVIGSTVLWIYAIAKTFSILLDVTYM